MFVHEEIIAAKGKVQKKHKLTKTEVVAQMAAAMHLMLELIEPSLQQMAEDLNERAERRGR